MPKSFILPLRHSDERNHVDGEVDHPPVYVQIILARNYSFLYAVILGGEHIAQGTVAFVAFPRFDLYGRTTSPTSTTKSILPCLRLPEKRGVGSCAQSSQATAFS